MAKELSIYCACVVPFKGNLPAGKRDMSMGDVKLCATKSCPMCCGTGLSSNFTVGLDLASGPDQSGVVYTTASTTAHYAPLKMAKLKEMLETFERLNAQELRCGGYRVRVSMAMAEQLETRRRLQGKGASMPDPAPKYCECVLVITESEAMPDGRMEAVIQFNVFEGITTVKIGCPKCGGTGLRLAEGKIEKVGEVKLNGLPIQIGDILKAAGLTPTDGHAFSFNSPLPPAQTVTTNLKFPTANYSFYDTADADGMKELHCGKYVVRAPAAVVEQLLLRKWEQGK